MPDWEESNPYLPPEKEVKVQMNIGPGLAGDPETMAKIMKLNQELSKNPASVEAMKEFMSKTVEQLAASDDQTYVETLRARGMDIVIPKSGTHRPITILFAALAALRNPEVDALFRQLKLSAQVLENGQVVQKRLVPDTVEAEPKPIQGIAEEKPARNILVGYAPFDPKKDRIVAVLPPEKGGPMWLGIAANAISPGAVEKDGVQRYEIQPLFGGPAQQVRETDLIPIRTEAQLAEIFNSIASQK